MTPGQPEIIHIKDTDLGIRLLKEAIETIRSNKMEAFALVMRTEDGVKWVFNIGDYGHELIGMLDRLKHRLHLELDEYMRILE